MPPPSRESCAFTWDWTVGPYATLGEFLHENQPTCPDAAALASRSKHLTTESVEAILRREPMSVGVAAGLSEATGISAAFWLNMERSYRDDLAAGRKDED